MVTLPSVTQFCRSVEPWITRLFPTAPFREHWNLPPVTRGELRFTRCGTEPAVVILRLQPPARLPRSPNASSRMKRDHAPFGSMPLRAESVFPNGPDGAGAGKISPSPPLASVGLYVPLVI